MKPKRGPWPAKLALYIDVDDLDAYGKTRWPMLGMWKQQK
jgi:hypothetical protein